MINKTFPVDLYKTEVTVYVTKTQQEWKNNDVVHLEEDLLNSSALSVEYINEGGGLSYILFLVYDFEWSDLFHETHHIMTYIYKSVGVHSISTDNDERECYFVGWLGQEVCKILKLTNPLKKLVK